MNATPAEARQIELRLFARAIVRAGLSGPMGHCSIRLSPETFLVCAAQPMGLIAPGEAGTVVSLDAPLPDGVLGEVRMHREIYRRRAEVGAVARFLSPNVLALAAMGKTPRARHGFGSYFAPQPPMWPDAALVRDDAAAEAVAQTLGGAPAIVVSVNGAVTAGVDAAQALALGLFLEDAARVELAVLAAGAGEHPGVSADQVRARATWEGRIAERVWQTYTHGDPESPGV